MTRGKGTQVAAGVLVLLFAAGSASAVPTFPVCLRDLNNLRWMTDSPVFDAVLLHAHGRDTPRSVPESPLLPVPQNPTGMITINSSTLPPTTAGQATAGDNYDHGGAELRGTTCEVPSPGTLLLGAIGAFLIGALRMRRML